MRAFQDEVIRLRTIPGVDQVTAWGILSEIGLDMNQFPSAEHLSSWASLCPGNFESARKRLSGKMRKGNVSHLAAQSLPGALKITGTQDRKSTRLNTVTPTPRMPSSA